MTALEDVRQYVLFRLGPEEYGLPIERVSSIVRHEPATPVPRSPGVIEGVINLRGQVVPVVNLAARLFDTEFHPTSTSRIIVTESDAGPIGLAVDAASEVATIAIADIMEAPHAALSAETAEAFEGVVRHGDRLIILLDLDKALPRMDYESASVGNDTEGDDNV